MDTPNFTPEAIVGLVAGALDVAIQFGLHVTAGQQQALLGFLGLLAAFLFHSGIVRHGRAGVAAVIAAQPLPVDPSPVVGVNPDTGAPVV